MKANVYNVLIKIIRALEDKYGVIAYAYEERNIGYVVCISDYDVYVSDNFKTMVKAWGKVSKAQGIRTIYAYCRPIESKLKEYVETDNLVMNV